MDGGSEWRPVGAPCHQAAAATLVVVRLTFIRSMEKVEKGSDEIIEQFWLEPGETTGETPTIRVRFNMLKNFDSNSNKGCRTVF